MSISPVSTSPNDLFRAQQQSRAKSMAADLKNKSSSIAQPKMPAKEASDETGRSVNQKSFAAALQSASPTDADDKAEDKEEKLKKSFSKFVGQTLFGQLMSTMRKSVGEPAYMHGGRAEEIFQSQMDQLLVERISDASSDRLVEPMYELFKANQVLSRRP